MDDPLVLPSRSKTFRGTTAFQYFSSGEFVSAAEQLQAIRLSKKPYYLPARIEHNLLLCRYFQGNCDHPEILLKGLIVLVNQHLPRKWQIPSFEQPLSPSHITRRLNPTLNHSTAKSRPQQRRNTYKENTESSTGQVDEAMDASLVFGAEDTQDASSTTEDLSYQESEDFSVMLFNCALLHYQMCHYYESLYILERLFVSIEQIDDFLAILICVTLIDLYLRIKEVDLAFAVVTYLQKPSLSPPVLANNESVPRKCALQDVFYTLEQIVQEVVSEWAPKTSDEVVYTPVGATSIPASMENTGHSLFLGGALRSPHPTLQDISNTEFQFFLAYNQIKMALLLRNFEEAEAGIRVAIQLVEAWKVKWIDRKTPAADPIEDMSASTKLDGIVDMLKIVDINKESATIMHCSTVIFMLQAMMEYLKSNFKASSNLLKQLRSIILKKYNGVQKAYSNPPSSIILPLEVLDVLYYNNLGCIYFSIKNISLALLCFTKALKNNNLMLLKFPKGQKIESIPLACICTKHSLNWKAEIFYNIGLQCLLSNKIIDAFVCFEEAAKYFSKQITIWIRLAECCIILYQQWMDTHMVSPPNNIVNATNAESPLLFESIVVDDAASIFPKYHHYLSYKVEPSIGTKFNGTIKEISEEPSNESSLPASQSIHSEPLCGRALAYSLSQSGKEASEYARMCLHTALLIIKRCRQQAKTLSLHSPQTETSSTPFVIPTSSHESKQRAECTPSVMNVRLSNLRYSLDSVQAKELNNFEDAILLKLAYISLCQYDFGAAVRYSFNVLKKNGVKMNFFFFESLHSDECRPNLSEGHDTSVLSTLLAYTYATEGLIGLGLVNEAVELLESYMDDHSVGKSLTLYPVISRYAEDSSYRKNEMESDSDERAVYMGLTFTREVQENDVEELSFAKNPTGMLLEDAKCVIYTDLAYAYIAANDISNAYATIQQAITLFPNASAPAKTLLYLLMAEGKYEAALKQLKKMRR